MGWNKYHQVEWFPGPGLEVDQATSTHIPLVGIQLHGHTSLQRKLGNIAQDMPRMTGNSATLLWIIYTLQTIVSSPQSLVLSQLFPSPLQLLGESSLFNSQLCVSPGCAF